LSQTEKTLDVSLLNMVVCLCAAGETEDMNIQGSLILLGMTATTGVGLGTVAVNSGAIDIDDVSGLLAETTNAVSGSVAGATNTFGSATTPGSPLVTAAGVVTDGNASLFGTTIDGIPGTSHGSTGGSITSHDSGTTGGSSGTNVGTSSGTSHGTSSGSAGGSYGTDSGTNAGTSSGTNSGTPHGTTSGSAGGSYEDDESEDEDHEDESEDESEDEEEEEEEGDDD